MYKILIVDDSKFIRQNIKKVLHNSSKYEVVSEASNGIEALSIYRKLKPDAVTLDLTMDQLDGFKTLSLMVKLYPNAKIIVFSSLSSHFSQTECFNLGAKDFIAKPHFNLLPNALEQIFEGQAV